MITLLETLREMGLTPLECATIVAVVVLAGYVKALARRHDKALAKQEEYRAAWHKETREEVAALREGIQRAETRNDECDRDREVLHREVRNLKHSIRSCSAADCPMRAL